MKVLMMMLAMSAMALAQGEAGARFEWLNECGMAQEVEVHGREVEGAVTVGQLLECDGSVRSLDYVGPAQIGVDKKAMSAEMVTEALAVSWTAPNSAIRQWGKVLVIERQAEAVLAIEGLSVPSSWGWIRVTR